MSQTILGLFIVLFVPIGASLIYTAKSAAPWVPSRKGTRDLLRTLPFPRGSVFLELGCGDGRILFDLARMHPNVQFIGYELSIPFYLLARTRSLLFPNVTVRFQSIYQITDRPSHIYTFLTPPAYRRLEPIFLKDHIGANVFTNIWPLPNTPPTAVLVSKEGQKIYQTIVD